MRRVVKLRGVCAFRVSCRSQVWEFGVDGTINGRGGVGGGKHTQLCGSEIIRSERKRWREGGRGVGWKRDTDVDRSGSTGSSLCKDLACDSHCRMTQ